MQEKGKEKITLIIRIWFKKIILFLFTTGVIVELFNLVYNHIITQPKRWIIIDSIQSIDYESSNYPSVIRLNNKKKFSQIYENSFIINLYIKNKSDNELTVSNLKFDLMQYQCDFPIITIKGFIENNVYKVEVKNLSNKEINNLDINLDDEDSVLNKIFSNDDMNILIHNLKEGETKKITFFSLKNIIGTKVSTWRIEPYVIVQDENKNKLKVELNSISLNKNEYLNYKEEQRNIFYSIKSKYSYNITPDIIIGNDEIKLQEINEFIPAHETLELQLKVVSQVTSAFDLKVSYWIDDKEYSDDTMSFIIYNPSNNNDYDENISYDYYEKDIEIK